MIVVFIDDIKVFCRFPNKYDAKICFFDLLGVIFALFSVDTIIYNWMDYEDQKNYNWRIC